MMKVVLGFLLASFISLAQTAGTVTKVTTTTVTAVAGAMTCTFQSQTPQLPTGISVTCTVGNATLTQSFVIPIGPNAVVTAFKLGVDNVSWIITQPTAGVYNWNIVPNGTSGNGVF